MLDQLSILPSFTIALWLSALVLVEGLPIRRLVMNPISYPFYGTKTVTTTTNNGQRLNYVEYQGHPQPNSLQYPGYVSQGFQFGSLKSGNSALVPGQQQTVLSVIRSSPTPSYNTRITTPTAPYPEIHYGPAPNPQVPQRVSKPALIMPKTTPTYQVPAVPGVINRPLANNPIRMIAAQPTGVYGPYLQPSTTPACKESNDITANDVYLGERFYTFQSYTRRLAGLSLYPELSEVKPSVISRIVEKDNLASRIAGRPVLHYAYMGF